MALQFNHKQTGRIIGSGAYVFRHYGDEIYSITCNLMNCTGASGNPTTISTHSGSTATLIFTANNDYVLPDSIIVSGANYTWNSSIGTIILSNARTDVQITITA